MASDATNLTVRCKLCKREFTVASPYARSKAKYCPECRAVVDEERKRKAKARHNAGRERDSAILRGIDHGERDINRLIAEAARQGVLQPMPSRGKVKRTQRESERE